MKHPRRPHNGRRHNLIEPAVRGPGPTPAEPLMLPAPLPGRTDKFAAKDYGSLIGMDGFSKELLKNHFELYQGYVKAANTLLDDLAEVRRGGKLEGPRFAELKRRFGWEFNGIRLHELYFENLSRAPKPLDPSSRLSDRLREDFGGVEKWEEDFRATGAMRGIGWAVTYLDPLRNRLFNAWINEHDEGHFAGCVPVLIMDVFEHAFMLDYGTKKADYIDAFFRNIHWDAVTRRAG